MLAVPIDVSIQERPDRELVERSLKGDRHSFRQLYRRYEGKVRSTLYQLCGSDGLDDLVQEAFLRVWKGLPKFKRKARFSTWLYRITWNVAADRRQAFAKERSKIIGLVASPENGSDRPRQPAELPDPSSNSGQALMHLHYQDLVQRGLAGLSLEHRSVLVLHDLEDLPQKEIAEILEVPLGTVKSRLHHARAGMRKFLQQEGVQL
ncbi:MAG: sigma-70 family RNA polymerase sigma factor [Oscillatoria sp. SIO1A7]|nr:sigma-70 family RNA polymerase sigma factor [Oscillatoria sp. SIO1A7]